jgi:phage replication-related protein YjqB (UPF0714/DUF867 family)
MSGADSELPDTYSNFEQLGRKHLPGRDYRILYIPRDSDILVMAPHGGGIEFFTAAVAQEIAEPDFAFYAFRGIKASGNRILHITSHCFDEPLALQAVSRVRTVLTVHGMGEKSASCVMVGGLADSLISSIEKSLSAMGFSVRPPEVQFSACHPRNLCNRGQSGKGIQLELTYRLRKELKQEPGMMKDFAQCIREGVRS